MPEELKDILVKLEKSLAQVHDYLLIDKKKSRIAQIQQQMSESNFWSNQNEANKIVKELKSLKTVCDNFDAIAHRLKEAKDFVDIAEKEDDNFVRQLKQDLEKLSSDIGKLEFNTYLSGELDKNSAILSINAGAGGTESCDWANMLLRMYSRWAESKEYAVKIIDILSGDTAGIKNVTITVDGEYAYGYLKSESGVHRLVRISPFDANKRRHTSFASVDVVAQIEEDIKVEIAEKDIRIDVFRATGPGGQGVNTTDSAVRITHLPTGIVVNCQNERSQLQNKLNAMNVLRARLYEKLRKEQEDKLSKQYGAKQKIEWGSQIRSYVLHPYNMVKDHRTDAETGNAQGVLDGDLDMFIEAYLKKFRNQKG